jgi:hypothetical protein
MIKDNTVLCKEIYKEPGLTTIKCIYLHAEIKTGSNREISEDIEDFLDYLKSKEYLIQKLELEDDNLLIAICKVRTK